MNKPPETDRRRSDLVIEFIETLCVVPEGMNVGEPLELRDFQKEFIRDVYDNSEVTRYGILSLARKNGKTVLLACLVLCHVVGPMAVKNSQVVSGARSRDQAALLWSLAYKMIQLNPVLMKYCHVIPSQKRIIGIPLQVEYKALSADGSKNMGLSPVFAVLDEMGQVIGPKDHFVDSITSSQGAHENPLLIAISTQSPSDSDMLSIWIDDARRGDDPHIVCHVYEADPDSDLLDEEQWKAANPALGDFLNMTYLKQELTRASRLPSEESKARNLHLNQRISVENNWLSPSVWKDNSDQPDIVAFANNVVHVGLDLSKRNDLTAAVFSTKDIETDKIHLIVKAFTPLGGIEDRTRRDRVPYDDWVKAGVLIGVPGETVTYDWVVQYLQKFCTDNGIVISSIQFDRWRINEFKSASERRDFAQEADWTSVGQGYVSISPRMETFETMLLERRICHGNHPVLNMGAASAIRIQDPAGNSKLNKAKSSQKIDALIAALMSTYGFIDSPDVFCAEALIG